MLGLELRAGLGLWAGAACLTPMLALSLACSAQQNGAVPTPAGGAASSVPSGGGAGGSSSGSSPAGAPEVGVMTIRRLNRTEYANTLHDLTGTAIDYSSKFPPENLSFGFDNIGEALTVQPLNVELYEESADAVLNELFARPTSDPYRTKVLSCDPTTGGRTCVVQMLMTFAQYAYRRPVAEAEVSGLVDIAQNYVATGGVLNDGLKLAFKGVLLSPHFLFRVELDPSPTSKEPHRVSAFELASRLSYYLWSTMPDQALLVDAQSGVLTQDAGLQAQIERMLSDPRAKALVSNFAGQWLNLRRTAQVLPDTTIYTDFDDELRASLKTESELFFNELLQKARPASELLSGTFTYVNKRLAAHYGMPAPSADGFQRVDLTGSPRVGFLTQASFLTITSNPTRTSPVKRGKWVLDQLLCSPPPPPPPGVDASQLNTGSLSLRARLEQHRANEPCKSCHAVMDPIGLSFENFDGVGTYRTQDQYGPIDATGTLPTPTGDVSFLGASELVPILAKDARLAPCIAEKVLTYAVGRGFSSADAKSLASVVAAADASGKGLRGLFASVAVSEAFRSRRAVAE
jgi:hypothetical protein